MIKLEFDEEVQITVFRKDRTDELVPLKINLRILSPSTDFPEPEVIEQSEQTWKSLVARVGIFSEGGPLAKCAMRGFLPLVATLVARFARGWRMAPARIDYTLTLKFKNEEARESGIFMPDEYPEI